jgi:hypothetical protein
VNKLTARCAQSFCSQSERYGSLCLTVQPVDPSQQSRQFTPVKKPHGRVIFHCVGLIHRPLLQRRSTCQRKDLLVANLLDTHNMPDASNASLPVKSPVTVCVPPVPSTERGERCGLDGKAGRLFGGKSVLCYPSGKNVVIRNIEGPKAPALLPHTDCKLPVLVYRGHAYAVSACKVAPSGAYLASGDVRGCLRVWALDHEEHLCKYESPLLTGPIRDLDWDGESKRIALCGEKAPEGNADCAKAIQWDTGVTVGQLSQHLKVRFNHTSFCPQPCVYASRSHSCVGPSSFSRGET